MNVLSTILFLATAPTTVTQVVVYPDRASVTRTAEVACGPRATARFSGIPPAVDPGSFRARTSLGALAGLRAEERTRAEAFAPEAKRLDGELRKIDGERRAVADAQTRAQEAARRAQQLSDVAVGAVSREMADAATALKSWDQAFDSVLRARLDAGAAAVAESGRLRAIDQRREELQAHRARLTLSAQRKEWLAEVMVTCPEGQRATVELTYLVGGASWEPAYEARADAAGSAVELSTFATVTQATGEDWSRAKVILSTAVPRQNATPPEPQRLNVWAEERAKERKVLVRRDEAVEHAEESGGESKDAIDSRVGVRAQGLSVQLSVPDAADVPGDGTPVRLFVARTKMKARFSYRAAPRMGPFVFRVAELVNGAPFPLLPGPLDAFRPGGLIGRYPLERVAEGARFELTFGLDEGLRVKRTVVEEVQRDAGFFGNTRRFRFGYRFELANQAGRTETVELIDQVPVSEMDDVKVAIDTEAPRDRVKTTPGFEAHPDDGRVIWKLALQPNEKRTIDLAFHVDVPSSYDSGGL